jgi:hypothetical protein
VLDAGAEVARSFDATARGGGLGAIARLTASPRRQELELSLRWYDAAFDDPHAGAIAEPDQDGGERVTDEAGARARWTAHFGRTELRALGDVWRQPSTGADKGLLFARVDRAVGRGVTVGAWGKWLDADTQDVTLAATARVASPGVELAAQIEHVDGAQARSEAWLWGTWRPTGALRLHARVRLRLDEATAALSSWSIVEAAYARGVWTARLRWDLDLEPTATQTWLRLELEARLSFL